MTKLHTPAIVHPRIDLWLAGGLSIVAIGVFLLFQPESMQTIELGPLLVMATVINGAHFMASYRMLYFNSAQVARYRNAALYIPVGLAIYSVIALVLVTQGIAGGDRMIQLLLLVTALYLALHYTGQAWGMMASHAFLRGLKFSADTRTIFRLALKLLIFWQCVWSLNRSQDWPTWLLAALPHLTIASHYFLGFAFLLGVWGFWRFTRENQIRVPPLEVLAPFVALFFWYGLLYKYPAALLGVQISHAIQYLAFPMRVEMNRNFVLREHTESQKAVLQHLALYLGVLFFTAAMLFQVMPWIVNSAGEGLGVYVQVLFACINIHHFFIDGVIWKISNPIVKEELFAHVKRPV